MEEAQRVHQKDDRKGRRGKTRKEGKEGKREEEEKRTEFGENGKMVFPHVDDRAKFSKS